MEDLQRVKDGKARIIGSKRKRKLQKREDVYIWWSTELDCWLWTRHEEDPAMVCSRESMERAHGWYC